MATNQVIVHPLYYALLMFGSAGRGRMVLLDVNSNSASVKQTAYGVLRNDGTLRMTVLNKDTQDAAVSIAPGSGYMAGLAMLLTAPTIDSPTNVTLGGANTAADGSWLPAQLETLKSPSVGGTILDGSVFRTTVPAGSAMLISFGNGSLTVSNSLGETNVTAGSEASAYGQALGMVNATSIAPVPNLAGVTGTITEASRTTWPLGISSVAPSQVNFLIPVGVANGLAAVRFGATIGSVMIVGGAE